MAEQNFLGALTDRQVLVCTLWGEARGEPIEGRIAVGCVIRNRVRGSKSSYRGVCLAPWQFSCWTPKGGQENYEATVKLAQDLLNCEEPTGPLYRETAWVADGLLSGVLRDRVGGATHYYATWMETPPKWAAKMHPTVRVGSHLFFRAAERETVRVN